MSSESEVRALFRAEQAVRPAPAAIELGWRRLALDLAANVAPAPVATGTLKLSSWLISKWLLLGFTVGIAGVETGAQFFAPQPVPVRVSPLELQIAPHAEHANQPRPRTAADRAVPTVASSPTTIRGEHRPASTSTPLPSASAPATFDAELALIARAKEELDAHRPVQASAWLTEHAERFPAGVFAIEREALQILAACERGPRNETLARTFAARHPSSPLVGRLQRACGEDGDFSKSPNEATAPGERTAKPSKGELR